MKTQKCMIRVITIQMCDCVVTKRERRTLGSDKLIIFKCFRVISSLKKKTIQFPFSFNLYFQQKRAPKSSICHLPTKRSVWIFDVTNRTNAFSNFQSYHQVVMYLFNLLAKSCTLFLKYSQTINRNNILELTFYK